MDLYGVHCTVYTYHAAAAHDGFTSAAVAAELLIVFVVVIVVVVVFFTVYSQAFGAYHRGDSGTFEFGIARSMAMRRAFVILMLVSSVHLAAIAAFLLPHDP